MAESCRQQGLELELAHLDRGATVQVQLYDKSECENRVCVFCVWMAVPVGKIMGTRKYFAAAARTGRAPTSTTASPGVTECSSFISATWTAISARISLEICTPLPGSAPARTRCSLDAEADAPTAVPLMRTASFLGGIAVVVVIVVPSARGE